jgi:hypothetical protein
VSVQTPTPEHGGSPLTPARWKEAFSRAAARAATQAMLIGLSLFIQPLQTLTVSVVSKPQMAKATSLTNSTGTFAGAIGVVSRSSFSRARPKKSAGHGHRPRRARRVGWVPAARADRAGSHRRAGNADSRWSCETSAGPNQRGPRSGYFEQNWSRLTTPTMSAPPRQHLGRYLCHTCVIPVH